MSNSVKTRKWLGVALICLGVLVWLGGGGGAFFGRLDGHGFHRGMHGYGHHMDGPSMMWPDWHSMGDQTFGMSGVGMVPGMGMMVVLEYGDELDLSADQRRRISEVRAQTQEDRQRLLDRWREARQKMNAMLRADNPDPVATGQQYARCAELGRQLFEQEMSEWRRIDEILTEAQRQDVRNWRRRSIEYGGRW